MKRRKGKGKPRECACFRRFGRCPDCNRDCRACRLRARRVVRPNCFFRVVSHGRRGLHGFGEHTPPEVVAAWNARAGDGRVEALESLVRDMRKVIAWHEDGDEAYEDGGLFDERMAGLGIEVEG